MSTNFTAFIVMQAIAKAQADIAVWQSFMKPVASGYSLGRQRNTGAAQAKRKARKARRK